MFARSMFRSAAPLKKGVRSYASQSSSGGGLGAIGYTAIAAAAGGAGYWYYTSGQASPAAAAKAAAGGSVSSGKTAFTGGDQGFISLKLDSVEILSHNTKRMRFDLPEPDMLSGIPVASALITKYKGPEMEKAVIRPYTPTSDEDQPGYLEFVIKKYPDGPMSTHMHDMSPGQRLDVKGPIPKYPIKENMHNEIALICSGTGITPMYQVARAIFKNPNDKTKVNLIYGNVSEEDILLKKELNELENTYPQRFRAFYVLDNPPDGWTQGKGYITKDLLKTVLPEPKSENIKLFVCGPPGLYKAISGTKNSPQDQGELSGILKELGYSKDQVFKF